MLTQRLVQKAAGEQQAVATERASRREARRARPTRSGTSATASSTTGELLDRGVIGDERRLDWVDRIGEIKTARKLFDVRYSIDVQRAVDYPGARRRRRRRVDGEPDEARHVAPARGGPVPVPGRSARRAQRVRGREVVQSPAEPACGVRARARPAAATRAARSISSRSATARWGPHERDRRRTPGHATRGRAGTARARARRRRGPRRRAPPPPTSSAGCSSRRSSARSSIAGARATSRKRRRWSSRAR